MTSTPYQLVIFDCDGVLVDSEVITARVFAGMLRELGLQTSIEDIFGTFVGQSMQQCIEIIEDRLGTGLPPGFVANYHARTALALRAELTPIRGIEAALDALSMPCCVASNGSHDKMRTTLGLTNLLPRFEGRLFSVADVARGKPFPDVFLHAARSMGVPPDACAVVEDTTTGVTAGVAAGMTVYGYCAHTNASRLQAAGARVTFDAMSALPGLLAARDGRA